MVDQLFIELLGSILSERGKSLLGNGVAGSPAQRAIELTARDFPQISVVASALTAWCRSEDFATWIAAVREGKSEEADDTLVDSLITVGRFADGLNSTHVSARHVLDVFFKHLEQKLYESAPGLHIEAERQKRRHRETGERLQAISSQLKQLSGGVTQLSRVREPVRDFVGREGRADEIVNVLRADIQVGVYGMGGVGKTELALDVARRLRSEYPEQIMLNMRGVDRPPRDPADALASCIRQLARTDTKVPEGVEELTAFYQSLLSDRRLLLILDNIADDEQVRPLVPPAGSAMLLTARRTCSVSGVSWIGLGVLEPEHSRDLLTRCAPRVSTQTADLICHLCGHLPLAVRAAGGMLEVMVDLAAEDYAERLRDERRRLESIGSEGVEHGVRACFNLSYQLLDEETARVFRRLAIFPASFDAEAEERVCKDQDHLALSDLVRRNLVLYDGAGLRYRLHDLMRLFAADLAREKSDDLSAFAEHHGGYYMLALEEANKKYEKGGADAPVGLTWFDKEWSNIEHSHRWGVAHAAERHAAALLCAEYTSAGANLLRLRLRPCEHIVWLRSALECSRRLAESKPSYRRSVLKNLLHLGHAYHDLGDVRLSLSHYEEALQIADETEDSEGAASVLASLGDGYAHIGEIDAATKSYERAYEIASELGDQTLQAKMLANIGNFVLQHQGDDVLALRMYRSALQVAHGTGSDLEASLLCNIANICHNRGETSRAHELLERGRSVLSNIGDRRGEGEVLNSLGVIAEAQGDVTRALECYKQRLAIARDMDDPRGEAMTLYNLSLLLYRLGDRQGATEYAEQSLYIFEELEDMRSAIVRAHLGRLGLRDGSTP